MRKLTPIVALSGGKDSVATLIKVLGAGWKPIVIFCDTGFEHPKLYLYLSYLEKAFGINIKFLRSNKYEDFIDMVIQKQRFPSTKSRFCTEVLKAHPTIDYILDEVKGSFIIFQGIRAEESEARAKMDPNCTYFKYYLEPYGHDKNGKPKYHTYRKREILEFTSKYVHDVQRPVFDLTADQVFDLHKEHGIEPNPLYKENFGRVGCFPCINVNQSEMWSIITRYPERVVEISEYEKKHDTTFFPPNYIPPRYCSKLVLVERETGRYSPEELDYLKTLAKNVMKENGKIQVEVMVPTMEDVVRYLTDKHRQGSLFDDMDTQKITSCDSIYNICE